MIGAAVPRPRLTKATNRSVEPLDFLPPQLLLFHSSVKQQQQQQQRVRLSPPDQAGRRIPDQSTIGVQCRYSRLQRNLHMEWKNVFFCDCATTSIAKKTQLISVRVILFCLITATVTITNAGTSFNQPDVTQQQTPIGFPSQSSIRNR